MKGGELTRMIYAWESTVGLDRAIETIISASSRFNGKDVSCHLEAYKAELEMRDIPKARATNRLC